MNKISEYFRANNWVGLFPFYIFYLILTLWVSKNTFFWDTIQLGSQHAHFYFENHLKITHLPDPIDSGHIPFFGYILALTWTIFGYSLTASHFLMLPFLLGIVYQLNKLFDPYLKLREKYLVMLFVLADPTLLAQSVLVTPDIPLTFLFLLGLNGILKNKKLLVFLATMGLALVSMRGWGVAFVLFIFEFIGNMIQKKIDLKNIIRILIPYLPGGMMAILFLASHYFDKGWIVYHEGSPWAPCFERVDFKGFVYNIGIYVWRLIDFGRLVIWLLLIYFISKIFKQKEKDVFLKKMLVLSVLFLFLLPISMLTHAQLLQHRYLLPTYLSLATLLSYFLVKNAPKIYFYGAFILLLAGNLIIYPDTVAQGWDSTLAHLPYYQLRKKAILLIEKEQVEPTSVKTWFPDLASSKYVELKGDRKFSDQPLAQCKYCLYSNVYNGISEDDYATIYNSWEILYDEKLLGIKMQIFMNPRYKE